ncbi:MAG: hypothetical protein ABIG84_03975 [archaeon]
MNGRIIELVVGAAFIYAGYLKFSLIGFNHLLLMPLLTIHMVLFFVIGGYMIAGSPSMVVAGLGLLVVGISLYDLGFFNSFSVSYLFSRFQNQPFMFVEDFLMPVAAAYWAYRGGEF